MAYSTPFTLLSAAAITATGTGTTVDLGGIATAADVSAYVTDRTSGSVTVSFETSADGAAWNAADISAALPAQAAVGAKAGKLTGLSRYLRAKWTVAASTVLTLKVTGVSKIVYATPNDQLMGGLPPNAFGGLTAGVREWALEAASGEADSAIRMAYLLPLKAWGPELTQKVVQIADWIVLRRRGVNPEGGYDPIEAAAKEARQWLKLLAAGDVDAGILDSSESGAEGGAIMTTTVRRGW